YNTQPARYDGWMYAAASGTLTAVNPGLSQISLRPVRSDTFPSSSVSVTIPSNSKLAPGFVAPPLHASSHSRSLPGDRGSVFGGSVNASIFDCGIRRGLAPLNPHRIVPRSPTKSRPSSGSGPSPSKSAGRGGFSFPSYQVTRTGGRSPRGPKS